MRKLLSIFFITILPLFSATNAAATLFDFRLKKLPLAETSGVALIADFNRDGRPEPWGSLNRGAGVLSTSSLDELGISIASDEDAVNDARAADFNGDGYPDLIVQPYARTSDNVQARLYFNDGTGHFIEDLQFKAREYRGRGEGLIVADFNNDGTTDVFLPFYTYSCTRITWVDSGCPNAPQSYLLLNDGRGKFTEVADRAGIARKPTDSDYLFGLQPEGGQAVDINDDGLLDIFIGGKVFLNQGTTSTVPSDAGNLLTVPQFVVCDCGLPESQSEDPRADEGTKLLDWNNDGRIDVVLHHWTYGPQLFVNRGSLPVLGAARKGAGALNVLFVKRLNSLRSPKVPIFSEDLQRPVAFTESFGLNIYDLDNDGYEDILVPASSTSPIPPCTPDATTACPTYKNVLFRNTGSEFVLWRNSPLIQKNATGHTAFGDINGDGRIDVINTTNDQAFMNLGANKRAFVVEVLGSNGEQNQHGRVVRVLLPKPGCSFRLRGCTLTRVVDSGGGYHSQNQYPLLIGTRYDDQHLLSVLLPYQGRLIEIRAKVRPYQKVRIYAPSPARPTGRVVIKEGLGP